MFGDNSHFAGIKALVFDYGGTIDTCGRHWGRVIWEGFRKNGLPVAEPVFREAYVHGERTLGRNPIIKPEMTFRATLATKLRIEADYMVAEGGWDASAEEVRNVCDATLDYLYEGVRRETAHSRMVLERLSRQFPMALVSNFYGNIHTVLDEFGLAAFFDAVIESAVVGVRKPDPRIFKMGVDALGVKPCETLVVGDSISKDIFPAKSVGCKTAWLKGEGWSNGQDDETLPDMIIAGLDGLL